MIRGLMRRSHKVQRVALLTNIDHAVTLVLPILVGQPGDVGLLDSIQARGRVALRVQAGISDLDIRVTQDTRPAPRNGRNFCPTAVAGGGAKRSNSLF